ncbi:hypothetical protein ACIBG7_33195 [Nonomuraea sp. NPDC050328]|uniref:hypothetical protein n=1 Tax=Nonomuraea sp. NPDC050328 TaxID=3364361 RepID=UPI0037A63D65
MTRSTVIVAAMLLLALPPFHPASAQAAQRGAACDTTTVDDHDGDGVEDAVVGDPFAGPGAAYLLSAGKAVALPAPELAEGDGYGWTVRLASLNGDGCADVLVGAPYADVDGVRDAGAVYVLYGGATDPPSRLVATSPQPDAHFGWSLAAKGDLVAIGAPYEDEASAKDQGAVYTGKVDALRRLSQEPPEVPGNGETGDQYGWALTFAKDNSLVIGVPYENNDGAGRQVDEGQADTGSVSVIHDVLAERITATKWEAPDLPPGARFGYALAYSDEAGLAVSAPEEGVIRFYGADLKQTSQLRQPRAVSLAASPDGRLAIGVPGTGEVRVVGPGKNDRTLSPAEPEGRMGAAVSFSGNRLVVGLPDRGPYGAVAVLGRNSDVRETIQPDTGADFGAALG